MVFKIPEEEEPEKKVPSPVKKLPAPNKPIGKKPADPRRQQALWKRFSPHELHMHHVNHVQHMKNKAAGKFKPR